MDAGLRRRLHELPAAGRHQDHRADAGDKPQRQQGNRAELDHPAPEVGHPQHLQRQPAHADAVAWRADRVAVARTTRKRAGIEDNDWIEVFNVNGAIAARAVVSQRVMPGMAMMYHAQERIINMPGSEITGTRGGIHNSVTRVVLKPTHMIGGYAQLSYGFNYYGTVGTNRDEFVIVRKMKKIDWLDGEAPCRRTAEEMCDESPRTDRHGAEPGQVHRLPHLLDHLQERLDLARRRGIRLVQQRRDQAGHRLSQGMGEPGQVERRLDAHAQRQAACSKAGGRWRMLAKIFANPDLPQIDDYYEPFDFDYQHLHNAPEGKHQPTARPRSLITGERMEKIHWGPNWEEILGTEFAKRRKDKNFDDVQKEIYGEFEKTFMMYLPRLCEHCLNPACVGVLPERRDLQARGRRHRPDRPGQMPRLAHVRQRLPVQEDLLQLEDRQVREVHLLLPAHRDGRADRVLGNLRRPHPLPRRAAVRRRPHPGSGSVPSEKDLYQAQLDIFLDPIDPKVIAAARAEGITENWLRGGAGIAGLQDGDRLEAGAAAAPGIPHLADGLVRATAVADPVGRRCRQTRQERRDSRMSKSLRIPVRYLANLLTAGDEAPVMRALERLLAMRAWRRARNVDGVEDIEVLTQAGLTVAPGRGDVSLPRHRQLRRPLRDPDRPSRIRQ